MRVGKCIKLPDFEIHGAESLESVAVVHVGLVVRIFLVALRPIEAAFYCFDVEDFRALPQSLTFYLCVLNLRYRRYHEGQMSQ